MILFTTCKFPSLDRVWQFPIESEQTIINSRKTDESRGTVMCLVRVYHLGYVKSSNYYRGVLVTGCEVLSAVFSFHFVLYAEIYVLFLGRGFKSRVNQYIRILDKLITRFACGYEVNYTVL